jgi:hypothetical protein
LARRRKSDTDKLEIAARLRREATLPTKATAARVELLGASKAANAELHQHLRCARTDAATLPRPTL